MPSRQYDWQQKQIAKGNCVTCGKPRGADGTSRRCRHCQTADNARKRFRRFEAQQRKKIVAAATRMGI